MATEIATLGEFGLIKRLTQNIELKNPETHYGAGDDCAILKYGEDKDLEELVGYWERGQFDSLYEMIFGKPRPDIYIPERFR